MLGNPPAYEVAPLEHATERLDRLIPRGAALWPTEFARIIVSEAIRAGGLATTVAEAMLEKVPGRAEAVRGIADTVFAAQKPLIPAAAAIGRALGQGAAVVDLPGTRNDAVRLLRATVAAWRELARLRAEEPLYTKFDTSGQATIARARADIEKLGAQLYEVPVPAFPAQATPRQPVAVPTADRRAGSAGRVLLAAIVVGVGTVAVVAYRRLRRR